MNGLKARRQHLVEYSEAYYRLLARVVHVVGFDHSRDIVEFPRLTDKRVRVLLRAGGPDGPVRFERLLDARDTHEVKLFIDKTEDEIVGGADLPFKVDIGVAPRRAGRP